MEGYTVTTKRAYRSGPSFVICVPKNVIDYLEGVEGDWVLSISGGTLTFARGPKNAFNFKNRRVYRSGKTRVFSIPRIIVDHWERVGGVKFNEIEFDVEVKDGSIIYRRR